MAADRSRLPQVGPDPSFHFPQIARHTLSNGLRVRTIEHHNVPVITFVLQVEGGSGSDPAEKEGLAKEPLDNPVQHVHQAMWRPHIHRSKPSRPNNP